MKEIKSLDDLRPGDLIFSVRDDATELQYGTHVSMYIDSSDDAKFAHAVIGKHPFVTKTSLYEGKLRIFRMKNEPLAKEAARIASHRLGRILLSISMKKGVTMLCLKKLISCSQPMTHLHALMKW